MKIAFNTYSVVAPKGVHQAEKTNKVMSNPIMQNDMVSFTGNVVPKKVNVDKATAEFVANSLSTSTSGHRAVYGSDKFNPAVVELLTAGVGEYAKEMADKKGKKPAVIIGGDTRVATRESLPLIRDTLVNQGVDVYYIEKPVPTPLLALMAKDKDLDISVLLTASHNPWADGGYNLVTQEGAIAPPNVTKQIANNVVDIADKGFYNTTKTEKGQVINEFPYDVYKEEINKLNIVDWDKIRESGVSIHYDALQGTGVNALPKLLEDYGISCNVVKSGDKEGPNPTKENLTELATEILEDDSKLKIGLANDGDADRFGVIDEKGNFVTPNDVILLVAHHLSKNKGMTGDIVRSQATSSQLDLFAKNNNVNVVQTPVGFKYIAEDIIDARKKGGDILVAGEESGGLTVHGHIPEKDGVIALLTIADLVAEEKKPLSQILANVKENIGTNFRADLISKKLSNEADKAVVMNRIQNIYERALEGDVEFGDFEIDVERTQQNMQAMENYRKGGDGVKLYFTDGSSILVRKSGTEPKVKAYIETYNDNAAVADNNLVELREELDEIFDV